MWQLDPRPFEVAVCSKNNLVPLSYWQDDSFPSQTYQYKIGSEEPGLASLNELDLRRVVFDHGAKLHVVPLGGRAVRTFWEKRAEIPAEWWNWSHSPQVGFSQFSFGGLVLLNPHGVHCHFYLRHRKGQTYWGIAPTLYPWGAHFPSVAYLV